MRPRLSHKPLNRRDALALWHRINLENVRDSGPDLSTRQLTILTTVYLETGPHTVRSLAAKLGVTKAVIVRALDTLTRYKFIARAADPNDKRSVLIARTAPGSLYLSRFADQIRTEMLRETAFPEPNRIAVA